jgi:hypothetical protein
VHSSDVALRRRLRLRRRPDPAGRAGGGGGAGGRRGRPPVARGVRHSPARGQERRGQEHVRQPQGGVSGEDQGGAIHLGVCQVQDARPKR